ncbi:hypothetical protein QQM39_41920 [Streptomyces sp. DT2A-34]|uniref:hypothetical protein n=1 Tax=Streptomyces sp. DT2A-34 TaxID=3051182 RepID=UPI00265C57FE|nr:hypothetical protein [Streptomyces sp. DT2A-34]MDO0917129.1 hypothetical protein [Streptomyces sp. DT2A-34]
MALLPQTDPSSTLSPTPDPGQPANLTGAGRRHRRTPIGNPHIDPPVHGEGLERRLLGQTADRPGLTRTDRGWEHRPG